MIRQSQAGVTAVELAVILVVISVLGAVAYPLLGNTLRIMTSKGAVEQVAGAIRQARQYAITNGSNYCIQFSGTPETSYAIKTASTGAACDGATPVASETVANGAAVVTPADLTIIFDPVGLATNQGLGTPFVVQVGVDTQPASCLSTVGVTL